MLDIADELGQVLRSGEPVALATVVGTLGSTPRSLGTRMAVRADGGHLGTVGGGCGEAEVIRAGLMTLDDGRSRVVRADLTDEATEESETACGGVMDVIVARWDAALLPLLWAVQTAYQGRGRALLATVIAPEEAAGAMVLAGPPRAEPARPGPATPEQGGSGQGGPRRDGAEQGGRGQRWRGEAITWAGGGLDAEVAPLVAAAAAEEMERTKGSAGINGSVQRGPATARRGRTSIGGRQWLFLVEAIEPPLALVICGGGHIALPLCRMAKTLGFVVTVIDDRPAFADTARFALADRVRCLPYEQALKDQPLDPATAVVVVTRGHRHDLECVRSVLGRGAGYVGMIGSRRRVAGVREILSREGFPPGEVARLHAPIGLDIGAETPAEIALSILAEITLVRRGGTGVQLSGPRGE